MASRGWRKQLDVSLPQTNPKIAPLDEWSEIGALEAMPEV